MGIECFSEALLCVCVCVCVCVRVVCFVCTVMLCGYVSS